MTKADDLLALNTRLNTATNEIASDLKALRDSLKGGLSAAEADKAIADLTPSIERLEGLGADPADPVPTA